MSLTKKDIMKIPSKQFGLPRLKKFPMQDEAHLKAAIAYFHTAKPADRAELAKNIIRRRTELGSNITVTSKNPLYKYVPENMKSLNESIVEPLITKKVANKLRPILEDDAMSLVEVLISQNNLTDVDDLDKAIPTNQVDRVKILNAMKSAIMNDDEEFFPIMYTDFPVLTKDLSKNNGGVQLMEQSPLIKYDNSLNESCSLNPMNELEHIQFATLLREWNEGYVNCLRNYTYDRLIIESWKTRVEQLLEEHATDKKPETYQKLVDLGIKNAENTNIGVMGSIIDNIGNKADEMSVPVDVSSSASGDTITVASEKGPDGTMIQKGVRKNDDSEKYK